MFGLRANIHYIQSIIKKHKRMTNKVLLNIALVALFALSLTGMIVAIGFNATEALVFFTTVAIASVATAVTTWVKK